MVGAGRGRQASWTLSRVRTSRRREGAATPSLRKETCAAGCLFLHASHSQRRGAPQDPLVCSGPSASQEPTRGLYSPELPRQLGSGSACGTPALPARSEVQRVRGRPHPLPARPGPGPPFRRGTRPCSVSLAEPQGSRRVKKDQRGLRLRAAQAWLTEGSSPNPRREALAHAAAAEAPAGLSAPLAREQLCSLQPNFPAACWRRTPCR